ncbi:MAG: hypothetical protein DMG48_05460 [Acidobacteria bacterium]|nr:MAG: hypothetical protein DMG48_05460 [Acidobacteriota bacterium]
MSTMNFTRHRDTPRKPGGIVLPPELDRLWDELEWGEPRKRKTRRGTHHPGKASTERHRIRCAEVKRDQWHRKCAERLGRIIAAEYERERKRLLAETKQKLAAELAEIEEIEENERRQAAIKADLEASRKETQAYLQKLMAAAPKKAA